MSEGDLQRNNLMQTKVKFA